TCRVPPTSIPSSATSRPGRNSSTSNARRASSCRVVSAVSRIATIRRKAATNSRASFARITPRLAESESGLRTHGYPTASAPAAGSSDSRTSRKRGTGRPASARQRRIACLSRAALTAGSELALRPRRWPMAAATTVVGRVEDLGDFGDLFLDQPLDARLQCDVRGAAALAAAAHLEIDSVILHVDQLDEAAVAGDRRVDHGIDQLLDSGLELSTHKAP